DHTTFTGCNLPYGLRLSIYPFCHEVKACSLVYTFSFFPEAILRYMASTIFISCKPISPGTIVFLFCITQSAKSSIWRTCWFTGEKFILPAGVLPSSPLYQ